MESHLASRIVNRALDERLPESLVEFPFHRSMLQILFKGHELANFLIQLLFIKTILEMLLWLVLLYFIIDPFDIIFVEAGLASLEIS